MELEDVILVIDSSQSMYQRFRPSASKPSRIEIARKAATEFISGKGLIDPRDRVAIVNFGRYSRALCKLLSINTSRAELLNVLKTMPLGGSTPMHVGLEIAEKLLMGSRYVKRVIILSDGVADNHQQAVAIGQRMKAQNIFIDAIGIGPSDRVRDATLKLIASVDNVGNLHYRYIDSPDELLNYYGRLSSKLNISFSATPELDKVLENLGILSNYRNTDKI